MKTFHGITVVVALLILLYLGLFTVRSSPTVSHQGPAVLALLAMCFAIIGALITYMSSRQSGT
jgi:hypothetical protein